ncbi:hypothetical protein AB1Y20_020076 [Prymnesium parvum]|uniref:Uncharacterized protein n=1 Tax=Prymnesium parvum TaxID=97485 RepID=A0AB34JSM1_PRYPA
MKARRPIVVSNARGGPAPPALPHVPPAGVPATAPALPPRPVVQIPTSPAHNILGKSLPDQWEAFAPSDEQIVHISVDIKGEELDPPSDVHFSDTFLWNIHDQSVTPEAFAKLVCEDEGLPSGFAAEIAFAIARATVAPPDSGPALPEGADSLVPISLTSECRGHTLHDQFLWDLKADLTPEQFAQQLSKDQSLAPDLTVSVALALRARIASTAVADIPSIEACEKMNIIRSEKDSVEWSPWLVNRNEDASKRKLDAIKDADRRDRYRRRSGATFRDD